MKIVDVPSEHEDGRVEVISGLKMCFCMLEHAVF